MSFPPETLTHQHRQTHSRLHLAHVRHRCTTFLRSCFRPRRRSCNDGKLRYAPPRPASAPLHHPADPRTQVTEAAEKEWEEFKAERTAGVEEITHLRERVAEEESRRKTERHAATAADEEQDGDAKMAVEGGEDAQMDVDDGGKKESQETKARESEEKEKEKSGGSK